MSGFTLKLGEDVVGAKVPFRPCQYTQLEVEFASAYDYPDPDEFEFEQRGSLWFAAHHTGHVRFFSHPGDDRDHGGFSGAHYSLRMSDGSTKLLKGPWSSNSSAMNAAGFTPSMPCSFRGARQGYHLSGNITRELWLAIVRHFGVEVAIWSTEDGHEWDLSQSDQAYRDRRFVRGVDLSTEAA